MALKIKKWPADSPINQEAVSREWAPRGFDCNLWVDPPGRSWLHFVHEVDEVVVVREGNVEFEVEGLRAMLKPGQEVFIPAGADHSVWNRGDTTAYWFYGYRRKPPH